MTETYFEFGTPADRWDRAQLFFEAKEYTTAVRILNGLVEEAPEHQGARLLLARAYYHSAQLGRAERGCAPCWRPTRSRVTRRCCSAGPWSGRAGTTRPAPTCGWQPR
ncbi:tetratricopeptide repeat protein [Actinomadura keratinilytica]